MRIRSVLSHSGQAILEGAIVATLIVGLVAGTAMAARGNGGGGKPPRNTTGGGTIAWQMVADTNGNGSPNWGDTITFDVHQSATTEPHVDLKCSQNGRVVYGATTGLYDSYPWPWTKNMKLSSASWTGGSASCTAKLQAYSGSSVLTLATQNFTASA